MLTAAGVEAAQAALSGHHQLTVGLLHSPQPKENKMIESILITGAGLGKRLPDSSH